jgi:hypothetical protein
MFNVWWATDGSSEADQAIPFLSWEASRTIQAAIRNQVEDLKQEGFDGRSS